MSSKTRPKITRLYSVEDEALDQLAKEAEARLSARRLARAEAREIRMRELERQQKENDEQIDRHYDMINESVRSMRTGKEGRSSSLVSGGSYGNSHHSSEDISDVFESKDIRHQVTELEEKFRKSMITAAQLDNEKTAFSYHVDELGDEAEEIEDLYIQLQRDHKEVSRAYDLMKRDYQGLKDDISVLKHNIDQRDEIIKENGLVLVGNDEDEDTNKDSYELQEKTENGKLLNKSMDEILKVSENSTVSTERKIPKLHLVTREAAEILKQAGKGTIDTRLKRLAEEKQDLLDDVYRLRLDLGEERQKVTKMEELSSLHTKKINGPELKLFDIQRESNKQVNELKYKLKMAQQEIITLQTFGARLEGHLERFKANSENVEIVENELKADKRKLIREIREAQAHIEELDTANAHLQKRVDKLKNIKVVSIV